MLPVKDISFKTKKDLYLVVMGRNMNSDHQLIV